MVLSVLACGAAITGLALPQCFLHLGSNGLIGQKCTPQTYPEARLAPGYTVQV